MRAVRGRRPLDPEAYATLTRPVQARLLQAARALCGDPDLAADLTQEALVRGFVAFDRFRSGAPIYPWLARILRNVFLDHVRSAPVRRELRPETLPEPPSHGPSPLQALEATERAARVHAAISRLPADLALVVTLVDLQGLGYAEAAEILEIPVGTVRSRLSRARARLREDLVARGCMGTASTAAS